ncbi:MAG: PilZ domain-containing protein [Myxococcota bacterium]
MQSDNPTPTAPARTILLHASRDALGAMTDVILAKLGYAIVEPESFEVLRSESPELRPDLLLVDERRLVEATAYEDDGEGEIPIILLTGQHGATGADSRIVGAVKRPAGMHDLYRLLQQVFEDTPRSTPRIATQLRAQCSRGDRSWEGRVLSLSQNGCLIRSPEAIQLGQKIQLAVELPRAGEITLEAEASYQLLPDVGLVFSAVPAAQRQTIERFVAQALLG